MTAVFFAVWGFQKKKKNPIFKTMNSQRPTTSEVNYKVSGPPLDPNKASVSIHSTLAEIHVGNVHRSASGRLPHIQVIELVIFRVKISVEKN